VTDSAIPELSGLRRAALVAGGLGVLASLAGAVLDPAQFFHSYLFAYTYWVGLGIGCLGILMVYHLTGGAWGVAVRRLLEAGAGTLPLMAVLFVPLLFGLDWIYPWTRTETMMADEVLRAKVAYLNVPFFIVRAAIYFAAWLTLAYFLARWSREQDRTGDPRLAVNMRKLSGGGLVLLAFTVTFAVFDWVMSLEPHWFSTIFGMLFLGGQGLGAMALVIVIAYLLSSRQEFARVLAPTTLNDLGNLLLAFVMIWAYLSFSQLLIIWAGNLPEEIPWYLHRMAGGWNVIALALAVFYFFVPFLVLLGRRNKRQHRRLATIALGILVARVLDLFFLIMPEFYRDRLSVHWLDVAALAGVGGLWMTMFLWRLRSLPLLAPNDPELAPALARKH
jgi:glycopeptide antibiotics resistance protein